jgi:hypothetical protein
LGISIDLPAAGAFAVLPTVADEALDILQRIAQEYADLMGEGICGGNALSEPGDGLQGVRGLIAIGL